MLFIVVGILKDHHISYVPIFIAASVGYMLSLLCIHLLVPNLEQARIELNTPA